MSIVLSEGESAVSTGEKDLWKWALGAFGIGLAGYALYKNAGNIGNGVSNIFGSLLNGIGGTINNAISKAFGSQSSQATQNQDGTSSTINSNGQAPVGADYTFQNGNLVQTSIPLSQNGASDLQQAVENVATELAQTHQISSSALQSYQSVADYLENPSVSKDPFSGLSTSSQQYQQDLASQNVIIEQLNQAGQSSVIGGQSVGEFKLSDGEILPLTQEALTYYQQHGQNPIPVGYG